MHYTTILLSLLSTGALALPSSPFFSYNGPLGATAHCPGVNEHSDLGLPTDIFGAPPNEPNYQCIPMDTKVDWIGINLFLSNASALQAFSDKNCGTQISWIEWPQSFGQGNYQFCAQQSANGGDESWQSIQYVQ